MARHECRLIAVSRHGEETRLDNQNPLVQTLFIPSRFLDRYGLELLVQPSAPTFRDRKTATIEQLLLPTLETPSAPGRTSPVQYPVHKTLLYGRGIDGLRSISRVLENLNIPQESSCIRGVVDVNWNSSLSDSSSSNVTLINLDDGETAVKAFRQSVKNSSQYEHCWINSNISAVETFIKDGIIEDSPKLKPAVKCLVSSIISDARAKVRSENKEAMNKIALATIPKDTREALQKSISLWAEGSHLELRSNVEQYILERSWRRLAWWKLFWRVDDVCMVVSDALRKVYLIRSEKGLLFLGGRLTEAGLFRSISVNAVPEGSSQLESSTSAPSSSAETTFTPATIPGEWIQNISQSRSFLLTALSPPLQAQAHKLLLKALSTSSLSVALSTLLYLSVTTPNLYEVGGIAAVGIVWSISQMQLRWESAKQAWIEEILSEGKKVLTTTEKQCRYDVEYGGRLSEDVVAASEREETQRALEKVEGALARTL